MLSLSDRYYIAKHLFCFHSNSMKCVSQRITSQIVLVEMSYMWSKCGAFYLTSESPLKSKDICWKWIVKRLPSLLLIIVNKSIVDLQYFCSIGDLFEFSIIYLGYFLQQIKGICVTENNALLSWLPNNCCKNTPKGTIGCVT